MRRFGIGCAVLLVAVLGYLIVDRVLDDAQERYLALSQSAYEWYPECEAYYHSSYLSYLIDPSLLHTVDDLRRISDLIVHATVERVEMQQSRQYTNQYGQSDLTTQMITLRTIQTFKGQHTAEIVLAQPVELMHQFHRGEELVVFLQRVPQEWGFASNVYFVPERLARYGLIDGTLCIPWPDQPRDYFPPQSLAQLIERIEHGDPFILKPYDEPGWQGINLSFVFNPPNSLTPTASAHGPYPYPFPQPQSTAGPQPQAPPTAVPAPTAVPVPTVP